MYVGTYDDPVKRPISLTGSELGESLDWVLYTASIRRTQKVTTTEVMIAEIGIGAPGISMGTSLPPICAMLWPLILLINRSSSGRVQQR